MLYLIIPRILPQEMYRLIIHEIFGYIFQSILPIVTEPSSHTKMEIGIAFYLSFPEGLSIRTTNDFVQYVFLFYGLQFRPPFGMVIRHCMII
jgi:hypothetical protein